MIIDGRQVAEEVYEKLSRDGVGSHLSLGILVGKDDPVIESFVRIKEKAAARIGVSLVRERLPEDATTEAAIAAVEQLAAKTHGIIVQLPLRDSLDTNAILAAIPKEKDVDGINPVVPEEERLVHAPVAEAIGLLLERERVTASGKRAAVVGAGRLVGKPVAALLRRLGAQVSVVSQGDSLDVLKDAAIVVLGAGQPGMVIPSHLTAGVVLFDAGTSESDGKVVGDADPACAEVASLFTPVPGGVGPIAVAMIFNNLFTLSCAKPPIV